MIPDLYGDLTNHVKHDGRDSLALHRLRDQCPNKLGHVGGWTRKSTHKALNCMETPLPCPITRVHDLHTGGLRKTKDEATNQKRATITQHPHPAARDHVQWRQRAANVAHVPLRHFQIRTELCVFERPQTVGQLQRTATRQLYCTERTLTSQNLVRAILDKHLPPDIQEMFSATHCDTTVM